MNSDIGSRSVAKANVEVEFGTGYVDNPPPAKKRKLSYNKFRSYCNGLEINETDKINSLWSLFVRDIPIISFVHTFIFI